MIADRYVWVVWASVFLVPWLALFIAYPGYRRIMLLASLWTAPFGLTEPLFVPEYWSPPSLFDLANRTGFDLESLIFSFGIGGVGAVLVNVLTRRRSLPMDASEQYARRHRLHAWALTSPFLVFVVVSPIGWNPIYPGIMALLVGAALTAWCRPDLGRSTLLGGAAFMGYYAVFLTGVEVTVPGYIERVWNLDALSGVRFGFMPVEELLFGFGFGAYWGSAYEHFTWQKPVRIAASSEGGRAAPAQAFGGSSRTGKPQM